MSSDYRLRRIIPENSTSFGISGMQSNLDDELKVSKEDEVYLRNHWKLVATSQFVNLFRNLFKLKDPLTPYDLEQTLLRPQHDTLITDLMGRLLNKRGVSDPNFTLDYETWNELLAKKFNGMYKNYRKFSVRFLNFDPDLGEIINNEEVSEVAEAEETIQEGSKKEEEVKVEKPPKKK